LKLSLLILIFTLISCSLNKSGERYVNGIKVSKEISNAKAYSILNFIKQCSDLSCFGKIERIKLERNIGYKFSKPYYISKVKGNESGNPMYCMQLETEDYYFALSFCLLEVEETFKVVNLSWGEAG